MSRIYYLCLIFAALQIAAEENGPEFSLIPVPQLEVHETHTPAIFPTAQGLHETVGLASWYGGKFQGRKTASGEIFDTTLATAAHRTLPFGTMLRVVNLENGKSTEVRVNDRGPFVENRIVDLSRKAATDIGLLSAGTARVRLDILSTPPPPDAYSIQISAFSDKDNANSLVRELSEQGLPVEIVSVEDNRLHRVMIVDIGPRELEAVKEQLSQAGYPSILIRPHPLP